MSLLANGVNACLNQEMHGCTDSFFLFFGTVGWNKLPGKCFQAERMFEILRNCLRATIPQLTDLLCKPQQHTQGARTNTPLNTTQIQ